MNFEIQYVDNLPGTSAAIDRKRRIIYINRRKWAILSPFERKFIIEHEKAHALFDTDDEITCDNYAFDQMAGTEWKSLKKSIATLEKLLVRGNHTRASRLYNIYLRALRWDADRGNEQAAELYRELKDQDVTKLNMASGKVCSGWWIFRSCKETYDPSGDAMALAQAEQLRAQTRALELANQENLRLKQEALAQNSKLMTYGLIAVIIIIAIW